MSYIDQSRRPSASSMAAVVAIHAAVGALLVTGLTVSGALKNREILNTLEFKDPPPPPPPPPQVDPMDPAQPKLPDLYVPEPKVPLDPTPYEGKTAEIIPQPQPPIQPGRDPVIELPKPTPSFEPAAARPKNSPAGWLSDRDYRPNWARQELTGLARYRLEIAANGRVTGCEITGSTGHDALDEATCSLIAKRARFEPARGRDGEAVAGTYNGSVMWQLPE